MGDRSVHYRYDGQGRKITSADPNGIAYSFAYNIVGQTVQTMRLATGDTGSGNSQITYAYRYPGGSQTQECTYDESGNLVGNVLVGRGPEGEEVSYNGTVNSYAIARDAAYRIIRRSDGNSHPLTAAYNQAGYFSQMTLANGETKQITSFDANGSPLTLVNGRNMTATLTYNDPESSLTDVQSAADPTGNMHFDYDGYGRITSVTDNTGTKTITYDDDNNVISANTTYIHQRRSDLAV